MKDAKVGMVARRRVILVTALVIPVSLVAMIVGISEAIERQNPISDFVILELGYGAAPISIWCLAMMLSFWKRRILLRTRYWRYWLAALLIIPSISGALAYFAPAEGVLQEVSLGGRFGQGIRGSSDILGALRIIGMLCPSFVLVAPLLSVKLVTKFASLYWTFIKFVFTWFLPETSRSFGNSRARVYAAKILWVLKTGRMSARKGSVFVEKAPLPRTTGPDAKLRKTRASKTNSAIPALGNRNDQKACANASWAPALSASGEWPRTNQAQVTDGWSLPDMKLLALPPTDATLPNIDKDRTSELIENTLKDYGIEVNVAEVKPGPVVTMFGLVPGWIRKSRNIREMNAEGKLMVDEAGRPVIRRVEDKTRVKVDSIVAREKDLALALAASSLRIEAPIPGASLVGIEVPNARPAVVTLRSVMETGIFGDLLKKSKLSLALGMGTGGDIAASDLAGMPHLLIAGSTGSGKSVCINSVIACIIMHNSPWETRLLLIDPKRVELTPYNGIPHLLFPVVVDVEAAVMALRGMIQEMLRRYRIFEEAGARNLDNYNEGRPFQERLPFIVIAVDELADLMMSAPYDIERSIIRLAQLGRATGIHLIVATQRPSVDVVTGLIKANFPSRISFVVASQVDSRTILDSVGAEKLLGRGDMLFQPPDAPKPSRVQGAFISDREVTDLVNYWRNQEGLLPPSIPLHVNEPDHGAANHGIDLADELLDKAWDLATQYNRLSTSLLQRRLKIGYPRAARLMDLLEDEGVVGPGEGGKSREVLVGRDEKNGI